MCAEHFNGKKYHISYMHFNLGDIWNEVSKFIQDTKKQEGKKERERKVGEKEGKEGGREIE